LSKARDVGIEPTSQPLEGRMLPLHQSRIRQLYYIPKKYFCQYEQEDPHSKLFKKINRFPQKLQNELEDANMKDKHQLLLFHYEHIHNYYISIFFLHLF
jgi:hypothetical protein